MKEELEYKAILGCQDYVTDPTIFEQKTATSSQKIIQDFIALDGKLVVGRVLRLRRNTQ